MPGLYRCDYPDAAFVTGVDQVFASIVVASAKNAVAAPVKVDITDFDLRTASAAQTGDNYARLGAPAGASIAADLVVIDNFVDGIETAVITNAAGADIAADIIAVKAETVLIVADTNELQSDNVPGLIATAQSDLDKLTGTDGATLATAQGNYAPAKAGDNMGTVSSVTGNVDGSVASVTGHTAQTGDSFARIGAAGASLTGLGGMATGMKAEVNAEADTALADYDGPTNAEMEARTPTVAQLAYIVENAATAVPVTFTTAGGSTTAAVLNLVDGSAASSVDNQYNGKVLVWPSTGTLASVVANITDYDGATKTATISTIPTAPTSSLPARLC